MSQSASERSGGLRALWNYLKLPDEVTDFERDYLRKVNKVGLLFFLAHPPVFVALAYFNDTGPLDAIWLSALVLSGPVIAHRTLSHPRAHAVVFGVTAMLMGGLLVHFGQGPVQIEMHFYFFVLLALLALYGNPMSIVAAAVTVAAHHAILWLVLPSSVFNYDAPFWVVAIHAAFVVLESTAACFVARSFFDNVIGLEKIVSARTEALNDRNAAMKLVLDNVEQGFVTMNRDAVISAEHSKVLETWFDDVEGGTPFAALLRQASPETATWFELGWDEVLAGFMPLELTLHQLPKSMKVGGRDLEIDYQPIGGEDFERMLVVITDATARVARERAEQIERELFALFQKIVEDKAGVVEFYLEARELVAHITSADEANPAVLKRWIHTLKGNAGIYGLSSIADTCHDIETRMAEESVLPSERELTDLSARWDEISSRLASLLGEQKQRIELDDEDYHGFLQAVVAGAPHEELAERVASWKYEPTRQRLARIAEQAKGIAERLGKGVDVELEPNDVRLPADRYSTFWSAFVHVVRNAVDHGIEPANDREGSGKSATGHLKLVTREEDGRVLVEISDDGRGIDWDEVRRVAALGGVPANSQDELRAAIFADGVTTREAVSDLSGRGVGMGAVLAATEELGGRVSIDTATGEGTVVRFSLPAPRVQA